MNKLIWIPLAIVGLFVAVGTWAVLRISDTREGEPLTPIENPVAASGKQTYHLEVDGLDREFIVYRPESLEATEEVPVVFMFHGSGQSGELFYRESGWKDKANEEDFMVIFPTGERYHIFSEEKVKNGKVVENFAEYQTKWSTLGLEQQLDPAYPGQTLADDIAFTEAMLEFVQDNYAVDTNRFYSTGFSNGGGFTGRLAVEMSEVFAAFAPTATGPITGAAGSPKGVIDEVEEDFVARPMIHIIGSVDPKLTFSAKIPEFTTDESAASEDDLIWQLYLDNTLEIWGLSDDYTFEDQDRISQFSFTEPLEEGSETEYHLLIVDGMKHVYPNGNNVPFDAADIFWDFFDQHSL